MDYRALGELIFMALLGLSVLGVVATVSFHFVLRPFLENLLGSRVENGRTDLAADRRLESLESRVVELEGELDRVRAAQEFDRKLGRGE